ncbi:MAG: YcaO-like family protein [Bacilli bacterium]|nr:YcaO-like family protein [Bacilli bacterium]
MVYYKDRNPVDTINLIKTILKKLGIVMVEKEYNSGVAGVFSFRIAMKNAPSIGSNGKGTSRIYALASAYAEFIERLANNMLFAIDLSMVHKAYYDSIPVKLSSYVNSPFLGPKKNDHKFLRNFKDIYNHGSNDCYAIPYERIDSKQKETLLFPYPFSTLYGSNGMAAGNSFYEMSVQAISEIFERYALDEILTNRKKALLYDNKKVLKIFPNLKTIFNSLYKRKYHIKIYDCSIGLDLPVFAVIVFDENKENYSVSFGGHPNAEFAITRCFTEMFQGLENGELKNNIHQKANKISNFNLQQILHNGYGVFSHSFLNVKKPSKNYKLLTKEYSSNKSMFNYYLSICHKNRFPLYYRDASYLGLSAGHYIIPGLSIMYLPDDFQFRFYKTFEKYYPLIENFINLKRNDQLTINEFYEFYYRSSQAEEDSIYSSTYVDDYQANFALLFALTNAICGDYNRSHDFLSLAYQCLQISKKDIKSIKQIEKIIDTHNQNKIRQAFIKGQFKRVKLTDNIANIYFPKLLKAQKNYYLKNKR